MEDPLTEPGAKIQFPIEINTSAGEGNHDLFPTYNPGISIALPHPPIKSILPLEVYVTRFGNMNHIASTLSFLLSAESMSPWLQSAV